MAVRLHNPSARRKLVTTLLVRLNGYRGRVRLYLPKLKQDGEFGTLITGGKAAKDFDSFRKWAEEHVAFLKKNQASKMRYNKDWTEQRIKDVHATLESGLMITLGRKDPILVKNITMDPSTWHTIFLLFDRPENARPGMSFPIEIQQLEARTQRIIGGMSARVDVVPKPK